MKIATAKTALDAAWDATLTRDLISEADYQTLIGPWQKVIGGKA